MQVDASTLGYMQDNNDRLHVMCMNGPCANGTDLNLDWLVELLGRDHSALSADIVRSLKRHHKRLRCSRCGGYNVSLIRIPGGYTGYRG